MLVGFNKADDAGVFRISETQALVQTLDFFTPIVDDPYWFGKIAAANSLSDVYAMGGKPLTAMSIVCFPSHYPPEILRDILRGGDEVVREAGAVIVGGHSVKDDELKYGLSVTGMVDPARLCTNAGAKPGDTLYLTKPLGTGIISTAIKRGAASEEQIQSVMSQMAALNRQAAEIALECGVTGMTDITGYGFLGHAYEMAKASDVTFEIDSAAIQIIPGALELAAQGYLTGGAKDNVKYVGDTLEIRGKIDENLIHLLWDPQTSGGLLVAVPEGKRGKFDEKSDSVEIGRTSEAGAKLILLNK